MFCFFSMKYFGEKKSGMFLKRFGFNIVESFFVESKSDLKIAVEKVGSPFVVKVFGKGIVHKKKLGGVEVGVRSYEEALGIYERFMKIKGAGGVVVQREIIDKGAEFLVGLQKTPEFGHVIAFGVGGSDVEKLGKVDFRVCPIDKKDAMELIEENFWGLSFKDKKILVKVLFRFCKLAREFPQIEELDINPLVISKRGAVVLDSRIVFEK